MTHVVVTGASGFLGHNVTASLLSAGCEVTPVTRNSLPEMYQVKDYAQTPDGDVLIHLAEESDRNKANQLGENYVNHSARVLRELSKRFPRIIYASSSLIYGDACEYPFTLDMPVFATDAYTQLKLLNEQIVLEAGGAVARLSNLFGAGMAKNNVLSDIIRQIPGTEPVYVRDDRSIRDFLHVSDAAYAFRKIYEKNFSGIINIGSGKGTSVHKLVELLLSAAGENRREIIATKPVARISINVLDISDAKGLLDWAPRATFYEQLGKFLEWSKGHS